MPVDIPVPHQHAAEDHADVPARHAAATAFAHEHIGVLAQESIARRNAPNGVAVTPLLDELRRMCRFASHAAFSLADALVNTAALEHVAAVSQERIVERPRG